MSDSESVRLKMDSRWGAVLPTVLVSLPHYPQTVIEVMS